MISAGSTHVVVLAAGRGSRLGRLGADTPKWLLDIGGRTIAERQLEAIAAVAGPIGSVRVVTGHADDEIRRFLSRRLDEVSVLFNPDYARLNNWYSVLLALRALGDEDPDARVAIINGDLFAAPAWIAAFLTESATTDAESLVGVDLSRELTDESMRVSASTGPPATIGAIGKVGVVDAAGEYVGLLMARGGVLAAFREALEHFVDDEGSRDEWYERAVALTAAKGAQWVVWPTPDGNWVEIDDDGDLDAAVGLATGGES